MSDTIEGMLGERPPETIESLLGPAQAKAPDTSSYGGALMDQVVHAAPVGRILSAFGQGFGEAWGGEGLWSPEAEQAMRKAGIFNDVDGGQQSIIKSANEGLIRPVAAGLDAAYRAFGGVFTGAQRAVTQAGVEAGKTQIGAAIGAESLARDIAALPEAFPTGFHEGVPEAPHVPAETPAGPAVATTLGVAPADIRTARDFNVIGPGGEAAWKGLTDAPGAANENAIKSGVSEAQEAAQQPGEAEAPPTPTPPTVHEVARQVAPQVFAEYDPLDQQRGLLRDRLAGMQEVNRADVESRAPHADEIADLEARLEDTTPRLAKKYEARLETMRAERDEWLEQNPARDTEEMASFRQLLLETDYRMRDLAPQVTAAYAEAATRMPQVPEEAPAELASAPPPEPPATATPTAPEAPAAAPETAPGAPVPAQPVPAEAGAGQRPLPLNPTPVVSIAQDMFRKLTAAGRDPEVAQADAAVTEAYYRTRAERNGGRLGTAEQLYSAQGPEVRAGRVTSRVPEMAQMRRGKIRLDPGRAIITMLKDQNASTFMHESGHLYLNDLLEDAAHTEAQADVKTDAATVRQWLKAPEGEIPTRAHEKFARGFERYLMEGVAPTRALAGVFEKFKGWLTDIYRSVAGLKVDITPDIRDVFDRLLTTQVDRGVVAPEAPEAATPEPPAAPKRYSPYTTVPKEPTRLTSFLRKLGGVRDPGGDIKQIIGGSKGLPGLLNETGMTLDDAALKAYEHGYFPDLGQRPDINTLINAVEEDLKGEPQYSIHDQGRVEDYRAALAGNKEVDRLAAAHGIDQRGLTREQFFARVRAKMGEAEADKEATRLGDEATAEGMDLAVELRDWEEQHGIGPDTLGEPRTQEDLEREQREADASTDRQHGAYGDPEPGPAGGPEANGQGGSGQGGSRAGTGESGGGANAHDPYRRSDERLVDKAGNIRLDNLNTPDDVSEVIRQTAAENDDFFAARRGVVSDAQVMALADALGMDPATLNMRKLGQAFNAEQIMAARKLLVASATSVRDAMAAAAEGDEAQIMAYAQAKARHLMIQEQVSGLTAEAGRALRAFHGIEGMKEAEAISAFLQQATGKTLFQMQEEAKLGAKLETPAQVSKFIQDTQKTKYERGKEIVLAYFINNLISGPLTHAAYSVGNTTFALFKATAETAVQATSGAIRERIAGAPVDRVYYGEIGAQLYAMARGFRDGLKPGMEAFRTGVPVLPEGVQLGLDLAANNIRQQVIPGKIGRVLELPSRSVSMIHTVFYTMGYEQEIARLAFRDATRRGLEGSDFDAAVAKFTQSPPAAAVEGAHTQALEQVLMNRPKFDSAQYHLSQIVNRNFAAKLVMPFMQIGMNILDQGIVQRTALGLLSEDARRDVLGGNGGAARDLRMGKIAAGSMLGMATLSLAMEGLITGGGPSDPNQRRVMEDGGWKAYSLKVGDTYIPYRKYLGPLGPLVSLTADMREIVHVADEKGLASAGASALFGFSEVVADETWMAGLSSFIDAARNWDTKGEQYLRNMATSFIPFSVGMSQVARQIDPYMREGRTWVDAFRNKIPGLSMEDQPQIGIWGQPLASHTMLSMTRQTNDLVDNRLEALDVGVTRPERKIRGVELTTQQYTSFAQQAGRMAKLRLDALVGAPGFSALPSGEQTRMIKDVIEHARDNARTMVIMQSVGAPNDIMKQATENKRRLMQ